MNPPRTLAEIAGRSHPEIDWTRTALVLIDHQREYVEGRLPLAGMPAAVGECATLLQRARARGVPVFHVRHALPPGAPVFADGGPLAEFIGDLAPRAGEHVVAKTRPNAFAGTDLQQQLAAAGVGQLLIAGFMTHLCVSTTTRAAAEFGYLNWVVAAACATRDLPLPWGETVAAADVQRAALAELNDAFATVLRDCAALPA